MPPVKKSPDLVPSVPPTPTEEAGSPDRGIGKGSLFVLPTPSNDDQSSASSSFFGAVQPTPSDADQSLGQVRLLGANVPSTPRGSDDARTVVGFAASRGDFKKAYKEIDQLLKNVEFLHGLKVNTPAAASVETTDESGGAHMTGSSTTGAVRMSQQPSQFPTPSDGGGTHVTFGSATGSVHMSQQSSVSPSPQENDKRSPTSALPEFADFHGNPSLPPGLDALLQAEIKYVSKMGSNQGILSLCHKLIQYVQASSITPEMINDLLVVQMMRATDIMITVLDNDRIRPSILKNFATFVARGALDGGQTDSVRRMNSLFDALDSVRRLITKNQENVQVPDTTALEAMLSNLDAKVDKILKNEKALGKEYPFHIMTAILPIYLRQMSSFLNENGMAIGSNFSKRIEQLCHKSIVCIAKLTFSAEKKVSLGAIKATKVLIDILANTLSRLPKKMAYILADTEEHIVDHRLLDQQNQDTSSQISSVRNSLQGRLSIAGTSRDASAPVEVSKDDRNIVALLLENYRLEALEQYTKLIGKTRLTEEDEIELKNCINNFSRISFVQYQQNLCVENNVGGSNICDIPTTDHHPLARLQELRSLEGDSSNGRTANREAVTGIISGHEKKVREALGVVDPVVVEFE